MAADHERTGDELLALATDAIPVFEAHDDQRALGRAWLLSGYVRGGLHCHNAAWQDAAERALEHYRRSGWPTAACFGELAVALYYGPTPVADAIRSCERLVAEAPEQGGKAHVLVWLGGLEAMAGRLDRGRQLVAEGRSIYEELGYRVSLANACGAVMGDLELLAGRPAAAEEWLQGACAFLAEAGMSVNLSSRAAELAEALYRRQRYDESERWLRVAAEHSSTDDAGAALLRSAVLAKVLARRGELAEAEARARHALELAEQTDALNSRAKVRLDLAEVLRLAGRAPEAADATARAVELFERKGNTLGAAQARRAPT
jgi:tetratricopeptide (TPR) repeat protein